MDEVTVTSDYLSYSHKINLALQYEEGEGARTFVKWSHPPTTPTLDIFTFLAWNPAGCHVDSFPQPLSSCSIDPPDCTILHSFVSNSTLVVNEDQVVNRLCVVHPTCTIFHDERVQNMKKNLWWRMTPFHPRLILFTLTFLVILPFFISPVKTHLWMFLLLIIHRTHWMSTCHYVRRGHIFLWKFVPSVFYENTEGEHPFFSFTPLDDSSNHEDADENLKFFNCGCHNLCTSSFYHNVDSLTVNLPKQLVSDNLSIEKMETLQGVEAHQPRLMVMSGPLTILRLVPLLIINFLKHPRLLITLYFALKINPTHIFDFLHSNHMIPSLMH